MKVFIDTNVLVSAILFPKGKVSSVFQHLLLRHDLIICSYSIDECEKVFTRKFPGKIELFREFLNTLSYEYYKTPKYINEKKYPDIRDKNDLPILVSAILSDADILLTGDKDFEKLNLSKPLIFSPGFYYELLKKSD